MSARSWTNWAGTVTARPQMRARPHTRADLCAAVRSAELVGLPIHAVGSGWSFSSAAATDGCLIDTTALNRVIGVDHSTVEVEGGSTLWRLYTQLDRCGRALTAMPGASGQTLAGAIATGSHGCDLRARPLADAVRAVHLIAAGGQAHWIEGDVAVGTDVTTRYPGITVHRDDALLRAVTVSAGRFGIVYAVVLDTVTQFGLHERVRRVAWSNASTAVQGSLAHSSAVQLVVNPYCRADGERDSWLTTRVRVETSKRRRRRVVSRAAGAVLATGLTRRWRPADAVAAICDLEASLLGTSRITPWLVRRALGAALRPRTREGLGYQISSDPPRHFEFCRGTSIEIFFDADRDHFTHVERVLAAIESHGHENSPPICWVSLRYMCGSRALLATQRWERTVAIEVAVLRGRVDRNPLLEAIEQIARTGGGTVHWGQHHTLAGADVARCHPDLPLWREQLRKVNGQSATFANDFSRRSGLEPEPGRQNLGSLPRAPGTSGPPG